MSNEPWFETLSVCETADLLRAQADDQVEALLERAARAGSPSQCRAGCAACCRQLVMVSPLEAHAIFQYLNAHPEARAGLTGRLEAWNVAVAALPELTAQLTELADAEGYPDEAAGGRVEEAYWAAQVPCPFLCGNRCSIYPVRPFSCREHHVVSPPELCQIELDRPEPASTRLEYRTLAGFVGSTVYFLADILMPLPVAVEYAQANQCEGHREADERQVADAAEEGQERLAAAFRSLGIEPPLGYPRAEE